MGANTVDPHCPSVPCNCLPWTESEGGEREGEGKNGGRESTTMS